MHLASHALQQPFGVLQELQSDLRPEQSFRYHLVLHVHAVHAIRTIVPLPTKAIFAVLHAHSYPTMF